MGQLFLIYRNEILLIACSAYCHYQCCVLMTNFHINDGVAELPSDIEDKQSF